MYLWNEMVGVKKCTQVVHTCTVLRIFFTQWSLSHLRCVPPKGFAERTQVVHTSGEEDVKKGRTLPPFHSFGAYAKVYRIRLHTMHLRLYIFDVKKKMEEGFRGAYAGACSGGWDQVLLCTK